jgi:hypothetical protein
MGCERRLVLNVRRSVPCCEIVPAPEAAAKNQTQVKPALNISLQRTKMPPGRSSRAGKAASLVSFIDRLASVGLPASHAADGRQGDAGYKKHLWRACIEEHPFSPI